MRDLLHQYLVELAAVIGALLGLRYVEDMSRKGAAAALVSGFACAYYGTPIGMYVASPPDKIAESVAGLLGLMLGFTGFALLAAAMKLVRKAGDAASDSVPDLIKRWLGGKGGKDGTA